MDISGFGLRDGILLAAGVCAVYFIFMLLRLRKISARKRFVASAVEQTDEFPHLDPEDSNITSRDIELAAARPQQQNQHNFGDQLQRFGMESEFQRLQQELALLRSEMSSLRGDLERLKAAQSVSPLYSEAMNLAERGHDAAGIAGRCGISIAEAELVAALAANRGEFRDMGETEDIYGRQEPVAERRYVA